MIWDDLKNSRLTIGLLYFTNWSTILGTNKKAQLYINAWTTNQNLKACQLTGRRLVAELQLEAVHGLALGVRDRQRVGLARHLLRDLADFQCELVLALQLKEGKGEVKLVSLRTSLDLFPLTLILIGMVLAQEIDRKIQRGDWLKKMVKKMAMT